METTKLKRFAQYARRSLIEQVSAKLKLVLTEDSAARRESVQAIKKLESAIHDVGKDQVIERVAYIWFNRFCALRFMDVNRYTRIGVVSPSEGQFQPEILAEAKMGHIDEEMVHDKVRQQIFALLEGKAPSRDPQGEAYRLLVVAACNFWNKAMPFLFQRIDDYTELLMPDDLLSENSILAHMREAVCLPTTEGDRGQVSGGRKDDPVPCTLSPAPSSTLEVEVIGWLYQFYISEKKDEVFDGLKKNKKITPENIPAATQLFTPHWIVRYLVENSLGRLWMQNRPNSSLKERMEYYIEPAKEDLTAKNAKDAKDENNFSDFSAFRGSNDFLVVNSPEEIKICDPACGSGHMLTYAFDLLYAIYEEEGVDPAEIPEKILTNNLYGIEIDERAGELAAFALTMKALQYDKRFFRRSAARGELVEPNICVLENVHFDGNELKDYMDFVGRDLFTAPLQTTLRQFEEADNFGSLIRPDVTDVDGMLRILESKNVSGQLFISMTHQRVLQALRQADYLSPKYHVVIANPPYMGGNGMNGRLSTWAKDKYPESKYDLYSMFIQRGPEMVWPKGYAAMVTMQTWMFISTFQMLRECLLKNSRIASLIQIGYNSFPEMNSKVAQATAFVINCSTSKVAGEFYNLNDAPQSADKETVFKVQLRDRDGVYRQTSEQFLAIPGSPIAYWLSKRIISCFIEKPALANDYPIKSGIMTGNDPLFLRYWHEVGVGKISFGLTSSVQMSGYWYPLNKGGEYRKWYGNSEHIINLRNRGYDIINESKNYRLREEKWYFKPYVTWSRVSSSKASFRVVTGGVLFADAAPGIFAGNDCDQVASLLNSKLGDCFISAINPTLGCQTNDIERVPASLLNETETSKKLVSNASKDWNSFETSWDFTSLPLLNPDYRQSTLKATYQNLRAHWQEMTLEMQRLEEENNRIFIDAYGLQDELTPEVPLKEITLTCNPHYRYGEDKNEEELEALLLADTLRELVSYAVGCMFGRYALDKPGLILANQGETIEDYHKILNRETREKREKEENNFSDFSAFRGSISFPADEDNVIPLLDGDWFTDDISERFRDFLKVAFGSEHYEENLRFLEQALNIKGKRNYTIRDYFLGEFYSDHVKRYKKRPIYWLFSSPKGNFNALVYMHRYRPDTVSVVLNDYLREFRTKLTSHKNHLEAVSISASSTQGEKTKALKEIEKVNKIIAELEEYERDVLYPLATEQVEIDLDDGVKVNYPKLGAALKKIPGLDAKEE